MTGSRGSSEFEAAIIAGERRAVAEDSAERARLLRVAARVLDNVNKADGSAVDDLSLGNSLNEAGLWSDNHETLHDLIRAAQDEVERAFELESGIAQRAAGYGDVEGAIEDIMAAPARAETSE